MFQIADTAAQKIKEVLAKKNKPDGFLRVAIIPGGCSGLEYELDLVDEPAKSDQVFEMAGAKVLLDGRSALHLSDAQLVWKQSLMKTGFEIVNPEAKSSCECGESFSLGGKAAIEMGESIQKCT